MSAQAIPERVETRHLKTVSACGWGPILLMAIGGLSFGFLLWYELAAHFAGPDHLAEFDLLPLLMLGLLTVSVAWYFYSLYFASRCGITPVTALRWNALPWIMLACVPIGILQPFSALPTSRVAAIAVGLWALGKLIVATRFNQTVREVCVAFLATRLPIMIIAELAYVIIGQRAGTHISESNNPLLAVWGRWDAVHYIDIARHGYYGTDMAFFPLYPALIHLLAMSVGDDLIAGLLISNIAFFFGLLYCYKLTEHQYNRGVAYRTIFYISIFPTAVFFSAVYTESLFFALTVASFYYIRAHRWVIAGIFGGLAAMTRVEGILLLAPYLIELAGSAGAQAWYRSVRGTISVFIGAVLIPLGLSLYMVWLWILRGDPLYFSHIQTHWDRHLAWPWVSVLHAFKLIQKNQPTTTATQCLELSFTALMIILLLAGIKRLRFSYWSYMLLSILAPMSTSSLMSMPRFALVLFPMFVVLGLWGARPSVNNTIVAISLPLLGLFTVLFANWYWVA